MLHTADVRNRTCTILVFLIVFIHRCRSWNTSFTIGREKAALNSSNTLYVRDIEALFKCFDHQFQCKRTKKCINRDLVLIFLLYQTSPLPDCDSKGKNFSLGMIWVRNGRSNCGRGDNSDEELPLKSCSADEHRCRFNGQCVKRKEVNDLIARCHDRSDSGGIKDLPCRKKSEFRCWNGQCVPRYYIGSWMYGCPRSSSEHNSKLRLACNEYEFHCKANGRCIPRYKVRDRLKDCSDKEDESPSSILSNCGPSTGEYRCLGTAHRCIPRWMIGDGRPDCENSTDELLGILENCTDKEFACTTIDSEGKRIVVRCIPKSWVNDGIPHCHDGSDEDMGETVACSPQEHSCDIGKRCLSSDQICDGVADCHDCSDEINSLCTTSSNYLKCAKPGWLGETFTKDGVMSSHCILRSYFCDGKRDCADGSDEMQVSADIKCRVSRGSISRVCVLPHDMINDGIVDCDDASDEEKYATADDRITCLTNDITADRQIRIFRKQLCDGVIDCPNLTDECLCALRKLDESEHDSVTSEICNKICFDHIKTDLRVDKERDELFQTSTGFKHLANSSVQPCDMCETGHMLCKGFVDSKFTQELNDQSIWKCINLSRVCDGKWDCENGIDEFYCSSDIKSKRSTSPEPEVQKVTCPHSYFAERYSELSTTANLCDGIPECIGLTDECTVVGDSAINDIADSKKKICGNREREPSYCALAGRIWCIEELVQPLLPYQLCDGVLHCSNGLDEKFCKETRFTCDVAAGSSSNDAGGNSITLGMKVSIRKDQVCDGFIDCNGAIDELKCAGHFYCRDKKLPLFVTRNKILDGVRDCLDGSDECPDPDIFDDDPISSRWEMLANPIIRVWLQLIVIPALVGNLVVITAKVIKISRFVSISSMLENLGISQWKIFSSLSKLGRNQSSSKNTGALARCNDVLVLNLAISDFITGIYLAILCIRSLEFSGAYCNKEKLWRSSDQCKDIGTMVMVSMQTSIVIMVALTSYRLYAVVFPWRAGQLRVPVAFLWSLIAWLVAATSAVIPRLQAVEDSFVKSVWLSVNESHSQYFPYDTVRKSNLLQFIHYTSILTGRTNSSTPQQVIDSTSNTSWNALLKSLRSFLPQTTVQGLFGYYSTHGVCLPSLFSNPHFLTRRISSVKFPDLPIDVSRAYSAFIISFNFTACLFIVVAYSIVAYRARFRGSRKRKSPHSESTSASQHARISTCDASVNTINGARLNLTKKTVKKQTRLYSVNKKIARLVMTNCACWLPICIIAFVSYGGVALPGWLYSFTAAVLIPINSVVNPFIYSDVVHEGFARLLKKTKNLSVPSKNLRSGNSKDNENLCKDHVCEMSSQKMKSNNEPTESVHRPTSIALHSHATGRLHKNSSSDSGGNIRSRLFKIGSLLSGNNSSSNKSSNCEKQECLLPPINQSEGRSESITLKTLNTVVAPLTPDGNAKRKVSNASTTSKKSEFGV